MPKNLGEKGIPATVCASLFTEVRRAPVYLPLRPVGRGDGQKWCLCFDGEILELLRSDKAAALRVHRDEAARYLRFTRDLRWGLTLTFSVVEGLKAYAFSCTPHELQTLLSWLPNKSKKERAREVRFAGGAVVLFGITYLLLPGMLSPWFGAALLTAGCLALTITHRACFLLNGIVLVVAGLWSLFSLPAAGVDPRALPEEFRIVPLVIGSVLVLWGIQQATMLGPNQELRVARAMRDARKSLWSQRSRMARRIAVWNASAALIFAAYAAALAAAIWTGRGLYEPLALEAQVYGVLALLAGGSCAVLRKGAGPAFAEAKVSGQALLGVAVFSVWGLAFTAVAPSAERPTGILVNNLLLLQSPYVWISLILSILLFNRWFSRAADREAEELRYA